MQKMGNGSLLIPLPFFFEGGASLQKIGPIGAP